MFKTLACFAFAFALCSAANYHRHLDPTGGLEETKWMDREIPAGLSPFIVLGEPAEIEDFPYMLAMIDLVRGGFRCGASAISTRWSLSAAHCTDIGTPPNMINLRGGSTNRGSGGHLFFVQDYWNHPLYGHPDNTRSLEYDISILQTRADSLIQGTNVASIPLPPNCAANANNCCQICGGTQLVVTGWGRTEAGVSSQTLNQLSAPVHEFHDCNRIWGRLGPSFFCKAVIDGRDTCGGDSGSPLVTGTGANRVQHGVVSFGTSVCGQGPPSVNIRIEHPPVRDWIRGLSGI